jgi:hypothetical protein
MATQNEYVKELVDGDMAQVVGDRDEAHNLGIGGFRNLPGPRGWVQTLSWLTKAVSC